MENGRISRAETPAFIEHLRTMEKVTVESQIVYIRSFFNCCAQDKSLRARQLPAVIKNARSAEGAYRQLAHEKVKGNCLWKTMPESGWMFREDAEDVSRAEVLSVFQAAD